MNVDRFNRLINRWREEAEVFRRRGDAQRADGAESYALELQQGVEEWLHELLTVEQAVEESGYSYGTLQRRLGDGSMSNVGAKGHPRVRRCDLPRKGRASSPHLTDGPDLAGELLNRRLGQ